MGVIDILFGRDFTQVQIEHADLVMKGHNTSIVIRSPNGKYWKLKVSDSGVLQTEALQNDYIISTSAELEVVGHVD